MRSVCLCLWLMILNRINIKIDEADAQMDHGVLTIKIPKNEAASEKLGIKIS